MKPRIKPAVMSPIELSRVAEQVALTPFPVVPIAKLQGVGTENVLRLAIRQKGEQSSTPYPLKEFRNDVVEGLLDRAGLSDSNSRAVARRLILARIALPDDNAADPDQRLRLGLSALLLRGLVVVEDKNAVSPPTFEGAPAVGMRWSRISRHDYPDFSEELQFKISHGQMVPTGRVSSFADPKNTSFDGVPVLFELYFPGIPTSKDRPNGVRFRGIHSNGAGKLLRLSKPIAVADLPLAPWINMGNSEDFAWGTAHPAAEYKFDGTDTVTFINPVQWISGEADQQLRRLLVLEFFDPATSPEPQSPRLIRAFTELRRDHFDAATMALIRITGLELCGGLSDIPAIPKTGYARLCIANDRQVIVRGYDLNQDPNNLDAATVFIVESDQEDEICYAARFLIPGQEMEIDKKSTILPSAGDAALKAFRFASSLTPTIPRIETVEPREWNIELSWSTVRKGDGDRVEEIYDSTNSFEVQLEAERRGVARSGLASTSGRSLSEIIAAILKMDWNITPEERERLRAWLGGHEPSTFNRNTDPDSRSYLKPLPNEIARQGAVLLAPEGAAHSILSDQEIGTARRETWKWRFQLRALENAEQPKFTLYSDWTPTTDWFTPLPIRPRWDALSVVGETSASPPENRIDVEYVLYEHSVDDLNSDKLLGFQLIVRKGLVPNFGGKPIVITERILGERERIVRGGTPVIKFQYVDEEVVQRKESDGLTYRYECEINQLNNDAVVTKGEIFNRMEAILPETQLLLTGYEKLKRLNQTSLFIAASESVHILELRGLGWKQLDAGNVFVPRWNRKTLELPFEPLEVTKSGHGEILKVAWYDFGHVYLENAKTQGRLVFPNRSRGTRMYLA
jgi:hypothetical protein